MAEYTPTTTTDRVRDAWVYASTGGESDRTYQEAADLFNRWLAAHEAEVRERIAQDIEAEAEYENVYGCRAMHEAARIARGTTR